MSLTNVDLFNKYPRHNTINNYLDYLAIVYSDFVTVKTVGYTYEKRPLKTITISLETNIRRKNCIFLDAGTHAREWISISTALYCIYQLVEEKNTNIKLLEKLDWIILPVVNADGYEYTHEKDRFWRKNRKPIKGFRCIGTDCNRNYDIHWEEACRNPCNLTYRGERPFSEPETQTVKGIMESLSPFCKFYLTLHSHAQAFLYPWGYTKCLPEQWKELHKLAKVGSEAIKLATGTQYRCGSTSYLIQHTAAGGSSDYAFDKAKIPFAITMELPSGGSGFDPPTSAIKFLVKESWIGIKAMGFYIAEKYENTTNTQRKRKCRMKL